MERITQTPYAKVLQKILHVEVFISLCFFICMVVLLMCLQREGSGREMLDFVMQANVQVDFKNILLNFSEKKNFLAMNLGNSKPFYHNDKLSFNYFLTDANPPK